MTAPKRPVGRPPLPVDQRERRGRQVRITIYCAPELLAAIDAAAEADRRSRSDWCELALERALAGRPAPTAGVRAGTS